jgi:uncharacterized DUF497 family protein
MKDVDIQEIRWDDWNKAHIWERHQLTPEQVEEVCYGSPENILVEETHSSRLRIIGPKNDGKLLVIILAQEGPNTHGIRNEVQPSERHERHELIQMMEKGSERGN